MTAPAAGFAFSGKVLGASDCTQLDTSKYRVSCGTIAPEGREAVTDRCRSQLGGVDLRREDRVPLRLASVWFAQAAAVRADSQTARFML